MKKENYFHYYLIKYKNRKGIRTNNFNDISKFYTYKDIENIYNGIILEFIPTVISSYKSIKIQGHDVKISYVRILFNNKKLLFLTLLFLILNVILSFLNCFFIYFLFLFQHNYYSAIIIIFFCLIIFNQIFFYFFKLLKYKLTDFLYRKTFEIYLYKICYKQKISKLSKIYSILNDYYKKIQFYSSFLIDITFILLVISIIMGFLIISKLYIVILIIFISFTFIFIFKLIFNKYFSINKAGIFRKSHISNNNDFYKFIKYHKNLSKSHSRNNHNSLINMVLYNIITSFTSFAIIITIFLLKNINTEYILICTILLLNYFFQASILLSSLIIHYLKSKKIIK